MAMNDEETLALIVGGHTFGKTHGAAGAETSVPTRGCPARGAGLGWKNTFGTARVTTRSPAASRAPGPTSRRSGTTASWTTCSSTTGSSPTSPAGAKQWTPKNPEAHGTVPDAHDPSKRHAPMMLTTDLALKAGSDLRADRQALPREPGPARGRVRQGVVQAAAPRHGTDLALLGPWVAEPQLWQDPVPAVDHELIGRRGHRRPQGHDPRLGTVHLPAGIHRLGVGGQLPRHRQAGRGQRGSDSPRTAEGLGGQRPGRSGQGAADPRAGPAGLQQLTVRRQEGLARRSDRPRRVRGRRASAKNAGHNITVPLRPGRTDASQEQTDVESIEVLEPTADGFRNYLRSGEKLPAEDAAGRAGHSC